jgi:hypothetical protein
MGSNLNGNYYNETFVSMVLVVNNLMKKGQTLCHDPDL